MENFAKALGVRVVERPQTEEEPPGKIKNEIRNNYKKKLAHYDWRDDLMSKFLLEVDPTINL